MSQSTGNFEMSQHDAANADAAGQHVGDGMILPQPGTIDAGQTLDPAGSTAASLQAEGDTASSKDEGGGIDLGDGLSLVDRLDVRIREWFQNHIHGSAVSRNTEAYNHLQSVLPALRDTIIKEH